jgi:hypothetical protein
MTFCTLKGGHTHGVSGLMDACRFSAKLVWGNSSCESKSPRRLNNCRDV